MDVAALDKLIDGYDREHGGIVALLQDIQENERYLPREALERVAERIELPLSQLYGLATYYKAFYLQPRGKHTVTCCMGTACHVRGGQRVVETLERTLGVEVGETTPDLQFTLETVRCVGCCAVSPVVIIDEEYHGETRPTNAEKLIMERQRKAGASTDAGA